MDSEASWFSCVNDSRSGKINELQFRLRDYWHWPARRARAGRLLGLQDRLLALLAAVLLVLPGIGLGCARERMDFTTSSGGSTCQPRHRRVVANPLGGRHRPQEAEEEEAAGADLFGAGESDVDAVHDFWDEWGD